MIYWAALWKVLLIGGVGLFAAMAVVVSIGGIFDIKRLFARIAESHREQGDESRNIEL
jgi:hypothetical protein